MQLIWYKFLIFYCFCYLEVILYFFLLKDFLNITSLLRANLHLSMLAKQIYYEPYRHQKTHMYMIELYPLFLMRKD